MGEKLIAQGIQQLLLGREVGIECGPANISLVDDLLDGDAGVALLFEQLGERFEDGLSAPLSTVWGATTDDRALVLEGLRVLRKGGVHAINDEMGAKLNGDGEGFASMGFMTSSLSIRLRRPSVHIAWQR